MSVELSAWAASPSTGTNGIAASREDTESAALDGAMPASRRRAAKAIRSDALDTRLLTMIAGRPRPRSTSGRISPISRSHRYRRI
ncbi:MAG: hypothetical protein IE932_00350 [Sphingopyxis terrae]|nr:hypothetical protein [Sphingopyxis terrae]